MTTRRLSVQPAARIEALRNQIAHLKVLHEDAEMQWQECQRQMTVVTRAVLAYEAAMATYKFRVGEHQREIEQLERRSRRSKE